MSRGLGDQSCLGLSGEFSTLRLTVTKGLRFPRSRDVFLWKRGLCAGELSLLLEPADMLLHVAVAEETELVEGSEPLASALYSVKSRKLNLHG